jgi:hypothetical protein
LTLCIGLQALEASGRWDRAFQDAGDEAIVLTVALCVGAILLAAGLSRPRLGLSSTSSSAGAAADIIALLALVPAPHRAA